LARLHLRVHTHAAPQLASLKVKLTSDIAAMKLIERPRKSAAERARRHADGDRLCHGDFHPMNVWASLHNPSSTGQMRAAAARRRCLPFLPLLLFREEQFAAPYLDAYCRAGSMRREAMPGYPISLPGSSRTFKAKRPPRHGRVDDATGIDRRYTGRVDRHHRRHARIARGGGGRITRPSVLSGRGSKPRINCSSIEHLAMPHHSVWSLWRVATKIESHEPSLNGTALVAALKLPRRSGRNNYHETMPSSPAPLPPRQPEQPPRWQRRSQQPLRTRMAVHHRVSHHAANRHGQPFVPHTYRYHVLQGASSTSRTG
jgi:hypothetical protein